jgi:hypothetical protein
MHRSGALIGGVCLVQIACLGVQRGGQCDRCQSALLVGIERATSQTPKCDSAGFKWSHGTGPKRMAGGLMWEPCDSAKEHFCWRPDKAVCHVPKCTCGGFTLGLYKSLLWCTIH